MPTADIQQLELAPQKTAHWLRAVRLVRKRLWALVNRRRYARLGRNAWIRRPLLITGQGGIDLGDQVEIWPMARIEAIECATGQGRIEIGAGTIIHPFVHLGAATRIKIGANCLFASHVYITDHDHDWRDPSLPITKARGLLAAPVEIGNSVWLGERVMVLKGVRIGDGAVIGAGAVVTHDIPAHTVAVGSPARVVQRFDVARQSWVPVERDWRRSA